jgi:hypothetical protein
MKLVMEQCDKLPPALAKVALEKAIELDYANKAKFPGSTEEAVSRMMPMAAFLEDDVAGLWLHLFALPAQPTFTLAEAMALVKELGSVRIIAEISLAFPGDDTKKESGPFAKSSNGGTPTGPQPATT